MEPRSVALVGVPRRTGRGTFNILENLMSVGYKGKPFPVNPNAGEIMGVKAYPTVLDIPEVPDLAVMMLPRQAVPETVRQCGQRGIRAAIVVSDGFDEAGDEGGRRLQREVERIAGECGVRLVGPNSLGVVNNYAPFTSTFLPVASERVPVAFVSQSGGLFAGFHEFIMGKGLDLGNMCDVDFADALEYFAYDPDIKVVVLHIEGMKQGRPFFQAARRLAGMKPVLVLKTGRSDAGSRAIASHTGSLTGEDQVYSALAKQARLIRVDSVDDVCDFTKAFLHLPSPRGNRLGILTPSGGAAIMALDVLGRYGFQMARLSVGTVGRLQEFWPPWSTPGNPLDMMSPGVMHGYKSM
jgi:acetyltransferase